MTGKATVEQTCPVGMELVGNVTEALAKQVHLWSGECQRFLEWQRQHALAAEAGSGLLSHYEAVLRRLLASGRMLNAATSDPEFADRRAAALLKARLAQLQESWELSHPRMTAEEGEAFLRSSLKPVP